MADFLNPVCLPALTFGLSLSCRLEFALASLLSLHGQLVALAVAEVSQAALRFNHHPQPFHAIKRIAGGFFTPVGDRYGRVGDAVFFFVVGIDGGCFGAFFQVFAGIETQLCASLPGEIMLYLAPQDAMRGSPLGNLITEKLIEAATIAKIAGKIISDFIESYFHYQNPCLAMNVFAYSTVLRVAPGALFATIQIERVRPFIAI